MSVAEIIEALQSITAEERRQVACALLELEGGAPNCASDFGAAKKYVFENYGELLRRLASEGAGVRVVEPADADAKRATDKIFEVHHDLLRRLAE